MAKHDEFMKIVKALRKQDFQLYKDGHARYLVYTPKGDFAGTVVVSAKPTPTAVKNKAHEFRRYGFIWNGH